MRAAWQEAVVALGDDAVVANQHAPHVQPVTSRPLSRDLHDLPEVLVPRGPLGRTLFGRRFLRGGV